MNLGDGLLFELENGKPKLILLSHGIEKNPTKVSCRSRAVNILSSRQPSCVEDVHGAERPARQEAEKHRHVKSKAAGAVAASFISNNANVGGRSSTLTLSKTHENPSIKVVAKVKPDRLKHRTKGGCGKTRQPQNNVTDAGETVDMKDSPLSRGESGLKESMVCLTSEQLQQILDSVQTISSDKDPPKEHRPQHGSDGKQTDSKSVSSVNSGGGGRGDEEDRGRWKGMKGKGGGEENEGGGEGGPGTTDRGSQEKDNRLSGGLFSWLGEQQSESRAAINVKKAQWRRELDEQVALKQQQQQQQSSAPSRLQEDRESVLSVKRSSSHREQPAAIRSSLRLGEVTPMEEVLSMERKEEQKRRWLEELDQQREEMNERRRREKQLQNQKEDHDLWASHFDSLERKPLFHPAAPPPALSNGSERGEWEPSSSLSLVWDTMSSCGADSIGTASVDTTSGFPNKTSHLRTMTSLLDPAQIEEKERRRLKQMEQQRAIEAQMEERRHQREQDEARRREEEAEEERRLVMEREMLKRRYEQDTMKEKQQKQLNPQAEQTDEGDGDERHEETEEPSVNTQDQHLEDVGSSASTFRDTAVQTEATPSPLFTADRVQTPHVSAQYQPPLSQAAPPNGKNRSVRTDKENICLPGGGEAGRGDPYEPFARTERSRREKKRPEWNTQRPSRQFVPASARYPASLQRNRQESRLKRQAELLALQERTCLSRTNPPPPPAAPPPPSPPQQPQEPRFCSNPTQTRSSPFRKVDSMSREKCIPAAIGSERRYSPVPAVRRRGQSQQVPPSSTPPPVLEFIPYVRTDEVFSLDPLEPADTPPPPTHTAAPPQSSVAPSSASHQDPLLHPELRQNTHTHRQQEILRGLAQLRQGLLQKQRELEMELNPLLKRRSKELQ